MAAIDVQISRFASNAELGLSSKHNDLESYMADRISKAKYLESIIAVHQLAIKKNIRRYTYFWSNLNHK